MLKRLIFIAQDFSKQMTRKNIGAFAASTAFFLFISLIPIIILICSIIPYTPLSEANLMDAVRSIIPESVVPLIVGIISDVYDSSAGILSIAILVTLWSAGKGMLALIQGLNTINDVEENRNYFILRIVASLYTLIMLAAMVFSLLILVFGNLIMAIKFENLEAIHGVYRILRAIRYIIALAVITLAVALIYTYVPGTKIKFRMQLPGAIFSSVVWSVFSWFFSIYVDKFNGFSAYGSLTTIVILMLWLYACMYIIMIGAYINRYFKPAYQFLAAKRKKD